MPLILSLTLLATVCYAGAYVLQYHEAHEAPARLFLSPRLLLELARHPIWLLGIVAMIAGNVLQGAALSKGSLAVVEPLLTASLLFALPLSAAWRRERLRRVDWLGALLVSGGLGMLLGVGDPSTGERTMAAGSWLLVVIGVWAAASLAVAGGLRMAGPPRAAMLAAGAGALFGLQDAMTRSTLDIWHHGMLTLVTSWQPWVLVTTGIYGLTLVQSAYEAGTLPASLPALNIAEPVVGTLIGVVALGEHVDTSGVRPVFEILGAVIMVYGTWLLARSPLVLGKEHPSRRSREPEHVP